MNASTRHGSSRRTSTAVSIVAGTLLAGLLALPASARGEQGALTQLPSPEGCISDDGSGPCTDGDLLFGAFAVTVSNDGKNVYAALIDSRAVAVLARDKKTGALTQLPGTQGCVSEDIGGDVCTKGIGLRDSTSVAVSKDGAHVYVASLSGAVAVFARNKKTGALTQLPEPQGCVSRDGSNGRCTQGVALAGAISVAVSNDGKHVYVASQSSRAVAVFARDKKTGALTQLPGKDGCISEDGSGGTCTDGAGLGEPSSIAVGPRGKQVYVTSFVSDELAVLARDKKTGKLSQLPPPLGCISGDGSGGLCTEGVALGQAVSVAVSPDGTRVYVAARENAAVSVFAQDTKTGTLTQLPSTQGCIGDDGTDGLCTAGRALRLPRSVAVSKDGKHVYVASQRSGAVAVLQREK